MHRSNVEGQRLHWRQGIIIAGLESVAKEGGLYSGVGIKWGMPLKFSVGKWDGQTPNLEGSFLCCCGHHIWGSLGMVRSGGLRNDGDSDLGGG